MACLLAGCSLFSTAPDLSIAQGTYDLESVDGTALPLAIEGGNCPREIYQGEMVLFSGGPDGHDPLYSVRVLLRLRCDPNRLLFIDDRRLVEDFGEWRARGRRVEFASSKGFGDFTVPIESPPDSPSGVMLTLRFGGRMYTFRRT